MLEIGNVTDLEDGILFDRLLAAASHPEFSEVTFTLAANRFGASETYKLDSEGRSALFSEEGLDQLHSFRKLTLSLAWAGNIVKIYVERKPAEALPTLTLEYPNSPNADQAIMATRFVAAMQREGLVAPSRGSAAFGEGDAKLYGLTEDVARLRSLLQQQSRTNEEIRKKQEEDHLRRARQLDDDLQDRWKRANDELETNRVVQQEKHERFEEEQRQKAAELAKQEDELRQRAESLDLHGEREARRRLRREIQEAAKKQFENPDLSAEAQKNFNRVATLCKWIIAVALVIFLIGLFGPPIIDIYTDKSLNSDWLLLAWTVRAFAGAALAIAITFYVRWLSNWSHQVTKNELQSKQFALDLDRASWLVEMALEYEKEGKTLPPNLVESFSRGLFGGGSTTTPEQPSSALATLIANANGLKLGPNGIEAEFNRAGIKRADAQASAALTSTGEG